MAQKQRPPPWCDRGDDLKEQLSQRLADKLNDRSRLAQGAAPPQRIRPTSAPRRHSPSKDGRPSGTPYAPARLIRRPVGVTRLKGALRAQIYGSLLQLDVQAKRARDALRASDDATAAAALRNIGARVGTLGRALERLSALA